MGPWGSWGPLKSFDGRQVEKMGPWSHGGWVHGRWGGGWEGFLVIWKGAMGPWGHGGRGLGGAGEGRWGACTEPFKVI